MQSVPVKVMWAFWIKPCVCSQSLSCVQLFAAPWTVACQAPLSMGFPKQEYCSDELPFPSPGDLPDQGIKPAPPPLASGFFTISTTWGAQNFQTFHLIFIL